MAVVADKKEKKFEQVLNVGDLANPKLPTGSVSKLDVDADAYEVPTPPPAGRYDLRVALAEENAIKMKRLDDKDPNSTYYSVALECRIVSDDELANNRVIYAYVSSRQGRGQKISTLAFVLFKCGFPKDKLKDKDVDQLTLVRGFVKWLAMPRIVKQCMVDWEGYSKEQSKTIFRSMVQFPPLEDGQYEHVVSISTPNGGTEEITARLAIKDWGVSGDAKQQGAVQGAVKVRPAAAAVEIEEAEDEEVVVAPKPQVVLQPAPVAAKPKKAMPPAPAAPAPDEDEDLEDLFN